MYHVHHLGRFELDYPPALQTGEVMVRRRGHRLEMAMVFSQLVLLHQTDFFQQRQRAVDGSKTNFRIVGFGSLIKHLGIQVISAFFQDFQNELPLTGEPPSMAANGIYRIAL